MQRHPPLEMLKHEILNGKRIYTLDISKTDSHPAKFSPTDNFSAERIELKINYNIPPFHEQATEENFSSN